VRLAARAGKALDKVYLRLRDPAAFDVASGEPGRFDDLAGHKYALLVTFSRDGTPVPTPVWFGLDAGNVYTYTFADAGKVKRLRNDPRVLLAPCTVRGRPLGRAIEGRGRRLAREEWGRAERAIEANYGVGRRLYTLADEQAEMTYLEITPRGPGG
jgi:hypothetical protein